LNLIQAFVTKQNYLIDKWNSGCKRHFKLNPDFELIMERVMFWYVKMQKVKVLQYNKSFSFAW